ncbi:hypothetical protein ACN47E_001191 [Coniothyrium glycines]
MASLGISSYTRGALDEPKRTGTLPLVHEGRDPASSSAQHTQPSSEKNQLGNAVVIGRPSGTWDSSLALRFAPSAAFQAPQRTHPVMQEECGPTAGHAVNSNTIADKNLGVREVAQAEASKAPCLDALDRSFDPQQTIEEKGNDEYTTGHVKEPPSLKFRIPEDKLRAAMLASQKTRASYYSTKLYEGPNGEPLFLHYCKSFDVAERVAKHFSTAKVLGFDIEWRPFSNPLSIKQNASLIQLACEDRIALFHVALFHGQSAEELMPPTLKAILESPDILKVGVAVKGDFSRLTKHLNVQPQGVFELSRLHNLVEWYNVDSRKVTFRLVGLAVQVLRHLQLPLYKGEQLVDEPEGTASVRHSDWSQPLSLQQIQYAAADAYAGFRLYHVLEWKRAQLRPTPPPVVVCDYDSKKAPRPKAPRKKIERASKAEHIAIDVETSEEEDQEDVEDLSATSETLSDSQSPGEPTPHGILRAADTDSEFEDESISATKTHDGASVAEHRKVGRVSFLYRHGPEPSYPLLPPEPSQEDTQVKESSETLGTQISGAIVQEAGSQEDDDEFADADLEEALKSLDLDPYGQLLESPIALPKGIETDGVSREARQGSSLASAGENSAMPCIESTIAAHSAQQEDHYHVDTAEQSDHSSPILTPYSTCSSASSEPAASSSPEFTLATIWAQERLLSTIPSPSSTTPSRIRATIPHLRAYHLWHHQRLPLTIIATHLRDPPFPVSTVTSHILQAISLERLEYEQIALREVMMDVPVGLRRTRWKDLADKAGCACA